MACPVCAEEYDTGDHKPMIVCGNNHHTCQSCCETLKSMNEFPKCPICRTPFHRDPKPSCEFYEQIEKFKKRVIPSDPFSDTHKLIEDQTEQLRKTTEATTKRIEKFQILIKDQLSEIARNKEIYRKQKEEIKSWENFVREKEDYIENLRIREQNIVWENRRKERENFEAELRKFNAIKKEIIADAKEEVRKIEDKKYLKTHYEKRKAEINKELQEYKAKIREHLETQENRRRAEWKVEDRERIHLKAIEKIFYSHRKEFMYHLEFICNGIKSEFDSKDYKRVKKKISSGVNFMSMFVNKLG